jgi:hypothetical protein
MLWTNLPVQRLPHSQSADNSISGSALATGRILGSVQQVIWHYRITKPKDETLKSDVLIFQRLHANLCIVPVSAFCEENIPPTNTRKQNSEASRDTKSL